MNTVFGQRMAPTDSSLSGEQNGPIYIAATMLHTFPSPMSLDRRVVIIMSKDFSQDFDDAAGATLGSHNDLESGGPGNGRPAPRDDIGVSVHAGFPNAAADRSGRALDFNTLLIKHPVSTFAFRIRGDAHEARGIFEGDIAVIDRALTPRIRDLIVCCDEDGFVLSSFRGSQQGEIMLWGVITAVIHQTRPPLEQTDPTRLATRRTGGRP